METNAGMDTQERNEVLEGTNMVLDNGTDSEEQQNIFVPEYFDEAPAQESQPQYWQEIRSPPETVTRAHDQDLHGVVVEADMVLIQQLRLFQTDGEPLFPAPISVDTAVPSAQTSEIERVFQGPDLEDFSLRRVNGTTSEDSAAKAFVKSKTNAEMCDRIESRFELENALEDAKRDLLLPLLPTPSSFLCPITREIMDDPVLVRATGELCVPDKVWVYVFKCVSECVCVCYIVCVHTYICK